MPQDDLVILLPELLIAQYSVGFSDILEFLLGLLDVVFRSLAAQGVRMVLLGQLVVRVPDLLDVRLHTNVQLLVVAHLRLQKVIPSSSGTALVLSGESSPRQALHERSTGPKRHWNLLSLKMISRKSLLL